MIGRYHTGPKLCSSDYAHQIAKPMTCYGYRRCSRSGCRIAIEAEAEEIGVEHLLHDINDSTTTTLATRVAEQLLAGPFTVSIPFFQIFCPFLLTLLKLSFPNGCLIIHQRMKHDHRP